MQIVDELARTRDETVPYFELPEEALVRTYGPGKWSVRHVLLHLADAETVFYDRIRRVISEPRPVIWAFDQDLWSAALGYADRPLELSRDIYVPVRAAIMYEARRHYEVDGHREFVHSETGVRTLQDEFDKVARHNATHLEQIRRALA